MGWNAGGRVFEEQIIALYDADLLTPEILDRIAEPFKETDCDTGGFRDLTTKDGLNAAMVICKVMEPAAYRDAIEDPKLDMSYIKSLGLKPENMSDRKKWDYNDKGYDLFRKIWSETWGIF